MLSDFCSCKHQYHDEKKNRSPSKQTRLKPAERNEPSRQGERTRIELVRGFFGVHTPAKKAAANGSDLHSSEACHERQHRVHERGFRSHLKHLHEKVSQVSGNNEPRGKNKFCLPSPRVLMYFCVLSCESVLAVRTPEQPPERFSIFWKL